MDKLKLCGHQLIGLHLDDIEKTKYDILRYFMNKKAI